MVYLVASAQESDLARVREAKPELWRQVRRYNQPVQLALAAAEEVMRFSQDTFVGGGYFTGAVPTGICGSISLGQMSLRRDGERDAWQYADESDADTSRCGQSRNVCICDRSW